MIWSKPSSVKVSSGDTHVRELRRLIGELPSAQPLTDDFEQRHAAAGRNWTGAQKEHLIGWLGEYDTRGAYGRKHPSTSSRTFYNHFRCMPGLLWLAEALGEDRTALKRAIAQVELGSSNPSTQCAAFRAEVPWSRIVELIAARQG